MIADLITRNTQLAVSGLYYWTVEGDDGSVQIGKLLDLKSYSINQNIKAVAEFIGCFAGCLLNARGNQLQILPRAILAILTSDLPPNLLPVRYNHIELA